jgi:hypothetical protein
MKLDLPLLDYSTRFSLWQVKMQIVLAHPNLDDALDGFGQKDQKIWNDEEKQKDRKTLFFIHLHISKNIFQEVIQEKTASVLWLSGDGPR